MHTITLESETDFDGWRKAARRLALNDVRPSDVTWRVQGDAPELFEPTTPPPDPPNGTFNVPAKFVELAKAAILHRDPERFALLYRLLWRLRGNHDLLLVATDPDVSHVARRQQPQRHLGQPRPSADFQHPLTGARLQGVVNEGIEGRIPPAIAQVLQPGRGQNVDITRHAGSILRSCGRFCTFDPYGCAYSLAYTHSQVSKGVFRWWGRNGVPLAAV